MKRIGTVGRNEKRERHRDRRGSNSVSIVDTDSSSFGRWRGLDWKSGVKGMGMKAMVAIMAATVVMMAAGCSRLARPELKAGDKVVFFGDSITRAGVLPKGYVTLTRAAVEAAHPGEGIKVFGAGIGGNRVPDLQKRLDSDVLTSNPTVVVIYIGINDVWHWDRNKGTTQADFEAGLRDLIGRIEAKGARVLLATPTVIGEKNDGTNPNDRLLEEYAAISRRVAREEDLPLIDLRKVFIDYLKQHNTSNAEKGVLTTDGVHLNETGNRLLADTMLAALGA